MNVWETTTSAMQLVQKNILEQWSVNERLVFWLQWGSEHVGNHLFSNVMYNCICNIWTQEDQTFLGCHEYLNNYENFVWNSEKEHFLFEYVMVLQSVSWGT